MNTTPLVSVIIPVYNVEQYLPQCLESVVNQTYTKLEIICINDGSPDNSADILRNYATKDNRINILNTNNEGVSSARNTGIQASTGDYIMFLDSDDWLELDIIEKAISLMIEHQSEIALWNYVKEYDDHSETIQIFENNEIYNSHNIISLYSDLVGLTGEKLRHPEYCDSRSVAWSKIYSAKIIREKQIEFIDLKFIGSAEDLLFNVQYFQYINSAVCIADGFNHYRKTNSVSLTNTSKPNLYKQWGELHQRIYNTIQYNADLWEPFQNRVALSLIGLGLNIISSPHTFKEKYLRIKSILSEDRFETAVNQLEYKFLSLHWKMFFYCARYKMILVFILLLKMLSLITKKNTIIVSAIKSLLS